MTVQQDADRLKRRRDEMSKSKAHGDWIEHDGKGMPVDGMEYVEVRYRDETNGVAFAKNLHDYESPEYSNWVNDPDNPDDDIVAYRIVKENPDA